MTEPRGPTIYTVAELAGIARRLLEGQLGEVMVRGEVAGLKLAASGHRYFSLRGAGAAIDCILYKTAARFLRAPPVEGMEVIVRARPSLYEARGQFQLIVTQIEAAGEGALRLEIEKRRQKLAAEGLFEQARKRPLPAYPRAIGVVTSEAGAVWHDIRNVLARRLLGYRLILAPAAVQGENAPAEIIRALKALARIPEVDVILCGRGGGALADLMAFNDEGVVRAIAASPVPVISCVGHETDWTLADLAADLRAPTPSAAAELAARGALETIQQLDRAGRDLIGLGRSLTAVRLQHLDFLARRRAFSEIRHRLESHAGRLDAHFRTLRRGPEAVNAISRRLDKARFQFSPAALRARLETARARLDPLPARLGRAARRNARASVLMSDTLAQRLEAASPLKPLARGYALVKNSTGRLLRARAAAKPGEKITLKFADGELGARVETGGATSTPAASPAAAPLFESEKEE